MDEEPATVQHNLLLHAQHVGYSFSHWDWVENPEQNCNEADLAKEKGKSSHALLAVVEVREQAEKRVKRAMEDYEGDTTSRSEVIGFKLQVLGDFLLSVVNLLHAESVAGKLKLGNR